MLERYTRPEMAALWTEEMKLRNWLNVEWAWLHARMAAGQITKEEHDAIRQHAKIDVARMKEIEADTQHDMIAFVMMIQESLAAAGVPVSTQSRFHELLTSYNTEDPAMILMLQAAVKMILPQVQALRHALRKRAREHKYSYMIMRTHGQFAEPSTFAHLLLVFEQAMARSFRRLETVLADDLSDANISGAVGSYGEIDPALEEQAASYLMLKPALAETQILQRDRHAAVLSAIAVAGASVEQMCRTLWEMSRSEVGEVQEPRGKKQKGSSAMAHKKNPIGLEQMLGLARLLRANAHTAMENIATPEGRDISQSSVERHIFPDSTSILHYMLVRTTKIIDGLVVFPERMKHNLEVGTQGTWAGQRVRTALMRAGVDYTTAYEYIQRLSFKALEESVPLKQLLCNSELVEGQKKTAYDLIGEQTMNECFDYKAYLGRGIEHIYEVTKLDEPTTLLVE